MDEINLPVVAIIAVCVILLVVVVLVRNRKDKKDLTDTLNNDYKKAKDKEGDLDMDDRQ